MNTDNAQHPQMDIVDLKQFFEDTYESLQSEHGYGLDQDALRDAWRHIEFYWRKLEARVANRITETEVPLTLMNQKTPAGRTFAIHGVIDVVEENNQVTLYDIKSHELRRIQENVDRYAPQLEVYAHIWAQLRGKQVHQTCIIATDPPNAVKRIVDFTQMTPHERQEYERWDPVVQIDFQQRRMDETIRLFGEIVDKIESREFVPPTVEQLRNMWRNRDVPMICAKCDGRYSCRAYRDFARQVGGTAANAMEFYLDHGMTRDEIDDRRDNYISVLNDSDDDADDAVQNILIV